MRMPFLVIALSWAGLWWTADQQGQREFQREEYVQAAEKFTDPMWQGTAWYRAGEFQKAAQAFSRCSSPEARFNEGNAWLMQGKYDTAIANYEKALATRPDWKEARENRDLAAARAKLLNHEGGDLGDQKLGADDVVFDKKKPGGQDTEIAGEQATSDSAVQAIWLRRVQTRPADFLRSKFAYQLATESERSGE